MRAMHASIDSFDTSLTATFAPYLASARATPLPMFGPAPVTSATLPSSETSIGSHPLSPAATARQVRPADYVAVARGLAIGSGDRSCVTRPGECTNFAASLVAGFASFAPRGQWRLTSRYRSSLTGPPHSTGSS